MGVSCHCGCDGRRCVVSELYIASMLAKNILQLFLTMNLTLWTMRKMNSVKYIPFSGRSPFIINTNDGLTNTI